MFTFDNPIYLVLLVPILILAGRLVRYRSPDRIIFASFSDMPIHPLTWRIALAGMATPLFIAGLILIVLALARPQIQSIVEQHETDAIGIEMVLDISGSMARASMQAEENASGETNFLTRLDLAKTCFATFVRQRPHDLIGLVTFGGYAMTRVPLTADHAALLDVLAHVEVPGREMSALRAEELLTAMGDAVTTACARLEASQLKSNVMILLTDGGSNTGAIDPMRAAQAAKQLGIRIYTIDMGEPFSRPGTAPSDIPPDAALLQSLSSATGGTYIETRAADGLSHALAEIDRMETTPVFTRTRHHHRELFSGFLVGALALIGTAALLNIYLRRRIA